MGSVYEYRSTVTIGDTNLLQNMYFLQFFKLAGIARELWVRDCVPDGIKDLSEGLLLITKDAATSFVKDYFLYDPILVQLQFVQLRSASTQLRFRYFHAQTQELHAEGTQTIVFANMDHTIRRIPENWEAAITAYADFSKRSGPERNPENGRKSPLSKP